jgi:hypothetical protein
MAEAHGIEPTRQLDTGTLVLKKGPYSNYVVP